MQNTQETPNFKDKIITCQDCNHDFIFEAGEQRYYYVKELALPKRCPRCRLARKLNVKVGSDNG